MMNRFGLMLALLWTGLGFAQSELSYRATLAMNPGSIELEAPIAVDFEIDGVTDGSCLYVPAQDLRLRDILLLESFKAATPQDNAGRQTLSFEWLDQGEAEPVGPALYRLPRGIRTLKLKYQLNLGGWRDRPLAPRLLSLWHPVLLRSCPRPDEEPFASVWPKANFDVHIANVEGWEIGAPGLEKDHHWAYQGTAFSAVFYKTGHLQTRQVGAQTLLVYSQSESFEKLADFAEYAIEKLAKLTGAIKEQTLLLVETEDFEPIRTPGLLTLNRPQQPAMRYLQQNISHWNVWQLSLQIAQQWYGLGCRAATIHDHWLVQGLADTLVSNVLMGDQDYFELFAKNDDGKPYFNLNYRQAQDLAAASLSLLHPETSLLDAEGRSHPRTLDTPFIAYIRHAHFLRYLQWKLGEREFHSFLQEITASCQEASLEPKTLLRLVDKYRPGLGAIMMKYWQSNDWPDAALNGTFEQDGKYYARMHFDNELLLPVDLWITTHDGRKRVQFVEPLAQDVAVPLDVDPAEIVKMVINPGRAMFDKDRFNNRTGAPKINFFPGGARGLEDDAYTIAWFPFATKLPGEPFTIDLAWQTLRYLGSGLTGLMRYQPVDNQSGFNLIYLRAMPESSLFLIAKVAQDDGHVEAGERRFDLTLKRKPLWSLFPRVVASIRIRSKQILGLPQTVHFTSSANLAYGSEGGRVCSHEEEVEAEGTAYVPSGDFKYLRTFFRGSASCESRQFGGRLRLFLGSTKAEGQVPSTALYRVQNLDEAHVRLDKPTLLGALRIMSYNVEGSFPAALPLPDSWFILPRRSQFKLFYDSAKMHDPDLSVAVAGAGYSLPLGGDIAGKDTVTFLRFSLNGIFYRKIDDVIDRKIGILFDFSGNL